MMAKKEEKAQSCADNLKCRLGSTGGQAVIEGIMMKSPEACAVAVRREDGSVRIDDIEFTPIKNKYKILGLPIIRGVVSFIESMMLSYKTLSVSAEALGLEDLEEESKFEKWMREKFGKGIVDVIMVIAMILGLALGFGLFFFLPIIITKGFDGIAGGNLGWFKNLIEGLIKIAVFVAYLALVSLMKDIRRTFEYHGAEHKTIFCYESGEELTVENVKKYKRFHPRCGTSFLFVMLILSILVFSLPIFTWENTILRFVTKLLFMPLVMGIGYEFIRFSGKHDNIITKIFSAPGLWMQRITTREPDDSQIEIAILALKRCSPSVFPDEQAELEKMLHTKDEKKDESGIDENDDTVGPKAPENE